MAMPSQDEIRHQQSLLEIHRRNLAQYIKQQGLLGEAFAPPMIVNGIRESRENITRIKGILRGWGEQIADHVDDEAPTAPQPPPPATTPTNTASAQKPKKPRRRRASSGPDVYISYNDADEAWVSETLLTRLEVVGLDVIIDYRDFEIGLPRLVNIERAVERSRHTLIVMTPEWVESDWNAFQGLLASTEDPSGLQQKLLPLKLRPCKPPARIAMLEILDLTNLARREAQMERLVQSLTAAHKSRKENAKGASSPQPAPLEPASAAIAPPVPSAAAPAAASADPARVLKEKYLANLYRKLEAAYSQKSSALSQVDKVSIGEQIEQLEAEIEQIKQELR